MMVADRDRPMKQWTRTLPPVANALEKVNLGFLVVQWITSTS